MICPHCGLDIRKDRDCSALGEGVTPDMVRRAALHAYAVYGNIRLGLTREDMRG